MKRSAVIAATVIAVAIYLVRLDQTAGLYVDDAWYVVLAKALAQGDGYRLISSSTRPIVPTFPPGFPLMLAPLVAIFPSFPENVVALKLVSVAAMFALAAASFFYLHRYRGAPAPVAGAAALVTLVMPAFVILATSTIMAEAIFTLCQVLLAISVERSLRSASYRTVWIAGILAALTMLVRAAGLAAAVAAALCLWKARPRAAALFAAVAIAFYLPWIAYNAASGDTAADRMAHGGTVAYRYQELLAFRMGGEPSSGTMSIDDLAPRILGNIVNVFGRDIGGQLLPSAYRGPDESGQEVFLVSGLRGFRATGMGTGAQIVAISSILSVVALIGFISACRRGATVSEWIVAATIGMVVLVPVPTFRYVLPLAPFIAFYFFAGVDAIGAALRRAPRWQFGAEFRVSAVSVLLLFLLDHAGYVRAVQERRATWFWSHDEVVVVTEWMNANASEGAVATNNPGLVWLLTGRKTVALMNPSTHREQWERQGIRFAVALTDAPKLSESVGYVVAFESPRLKFWVLELLPRLTESAKRH